jgi:predicted esterase
MLAFKAELSYSKTLGGVIGLMGYARTKVIPQATANSATLVLSVVGGSDLVCPQDAVQRSHKREGLYDRENFVQEVWPDQGNYLKDDIQKWVATFIEKYLQF